MRKSKPKAKPKSKPKTKAKAKPKPRANRAKPKPPPKPEPNPTSERPGYEDFRAQQAQISRERSASGRDIGSIPDVANPKRRVACERKLRKFLEMYLHAWFPLPWSSDHLEALRLLELTILEGGLYAFAMPRGSGKTSMSEGAVLWAALYGHRKFIVAIAATKKLAESTIDSLKSELEVNDVLAEDFPEVCVPIRNLEGIANRCNGQTFKGQRTRIGWTKNEIVLPTIAGSASSAVRIRAWGLVGAIRGIKVKDDAGGLLRPDFVIPDDPQTDRSARSKTQNLQRETLINGAVLGLAGPDKKIAAVIPGTVIQQNDAMHRILNRDLNPHWNGQIFKMLRRFPSNSEIWEEYARIRKDGLRAGDRGKSATAFYRANRAAMDAGADVAWPARFKPDELSALQSAMNLWIDNPSSFAAEYQNDPLQDASLSLRLQLDADQLRQRLTGIPRGQVPRTCTRLTAGIDVQGAILYAVVHAWDESFGGSPIDYLTYPPQPVRYFSHRNPPRALADVFPGMQPTAQVYAGLKELTKIILSRSYPRAGNAGDLQVERCLIDAGDESDTIYQFCRQTEYASRILPSKGFGIGAKANPMALWAKRDGERRGHGWILGFPESGKGKLVKIDRNTWGTFVAGRLQSPDGTPGAIRLPGDKPHEHELFADHLASEFGEPTEGRGRKLHEWSLLPGRENHWLDCMVLAAVAVSTLGLVFDAGAAAGDPKPPETRRKVTLGDLYDRAKQKN
jgi:hypothetical protein